MIDYSVLMTVFRNDSPKFFIDSVSSMLSQTHKTNDFVLVCDGELTDELERCIEIVFSENKDILNIIRIPENVGLGQALNFGLAFCKNEWVARMDDDDIAHLDRCEKEMRYIEEHPWLTILGSYENEFEDSPQNPIRIKKVPTEQRDILRFSRRRNPFNHSTVVIKKQDIIAAGNYSTMRTNQDVATWVRVLNKGYQAANIPEALVDFRFDKNTYQRRKEKKNITLMIKLWWDFYKQKYCTLGDYFYVVAIQLSIYIMPIKLLKWAYDNMR